MNDYTFELYFIQILYHQHYYHDHQALTDYPAPFRSSESGWGLSSGVEAYAELSICGPIPAGAKFLAVALLRR